MAIHELKTLPEYFQVVRLRYKTFEIRKDDRGFRPGDTVILREWKDGEYTGDWVRANVTYITDFQQQPGYVVMGIYVTDFRRPYRKSFTEYEDESGARLFPFAPSGGE